MVTKTQFLDKIKRKLGDGAIKVHVTPTQVEDAYLRALDYYYKIVPDSTNRVYYKYQVTQANIDAGTNIITLPSDIHDVSAMYVGRGFGNIAFGDTAGVSSYQNGLYGGFMSAGTQGTGASYLNLASYYVSIQYMNAYRSLLSPSDNFFYSRFSNKIQLDLSLANDVGVDNWLLFLVDVKVDPEIDMNFLNDELLVNLASSYLAQQQATNLLKFKDVSLPGGVKFNVSEMLSDANNKVKEYEKLVYDFYAPACGIFML